MVHRRYPHHFFQWAFICQQVITMLLAFLLVFLLAFLLVFLLAFLLIFLLVIHSGYLRQLIHSANLRQVVYQPQAGYSLRQPQAGYSLRQPQAEGSDRTLLTFIYLYIYYIIFLVSSMNQSCCFAYVFDFTPTSARTYGRVQIQNYDHPFI